MRFLHWSIRSPDPVDFLPTVIGSVMLFLSLPAFVGVLLYPDRNSGALATGLLVLFALGIALGAGFVIYGVRICAYPGSLAYRLARGRIFFR